MKKILIGTFVLIILGIVALSFIGKENRDRFNPLLSEKDVYVLVNKEGKPDPDFPQRYMFMLDSVDETGDVYKLKITSAVESFPKNTFLKVHVKGKYVYYFVIVEEHEVPELVKKELKKIKS